MALGFFTVYLLGSVVAAFSPAIEWLVVGRLLQGIGGNRTPDPTRARPSQIARSYITLLRDRGFMRAGLLLGFMLGGIYTLAVLLPFVMIDLVGLTPTQFGLAMICQTGSYMLGAAVTGRALRHFPATRLIPIGVALGVAAGLSLAVGLRLARPSLMSVMVPVAIWAFGVALIMPGATTSALAGFPTIAGAAAALTGFLQIGGGLAGSGVAAFFRDPSVALTSVLPGMAALAALVHFALKPSVKRSRPEIAPEDIEAAIDPADILGAGGEQIEGTLKRSKVSGNRT